MWERRVAHVVICGLGSGPAFHAPFRSVLLRRRPSAGSQCSPRGRPQPVSKIEEVRSVERLTRILELLLEHAVVGSVLVRLSGAHEVALGVPKQVSLQASNRESKETTDALSFSHAFARSLSLVYTLCTFKIAFRLPADAVESCGGLFAFALMSSLRVG